MFAMSIDWYPLWNSLRIAAVSCVLVFFTGILGCHDDSAKVCDNGLNRKVGTLASWAHTLHSRCVDHDGSHAVAAPHQSDTAIEYSR